MVEKIIISPESIRGLGNIVMPKTGADFEEYNCTMEVGEDTVNGEDVTVYVLTPETTTISLVLSSSVDSCGIGDSVVLSVTVTEDSVPVSGASVSFKLGGTEIGTGTTNSSGVATYTYTATDVGSLNFTSVYAGHSSNSVSVVVSHDYSIAFSQSSYPATSGSATLELTLLDNSVPVSGATVSITGSDSSSYSCITNSSGVGSVTVSGVSVETTFTCSYQGVSDTCTVTVGPSYLFYDSCATNNTSQYTTFYEIWASSTTVRTSLSFDTDHYVLTNGNANFSTVCLPVTAGLDDWKLTAKIRAVSSSSDKGGGVGIAQDKEKGVGLFQPNSKTTKHLILYNPNTTGGSVSSNVAVSNLTTNDYNTYELTKDGTSLTFKIYNSSDTQVFSKVVTIQNSGYLTSAYPALSIAKSDSVYVKEIKLEAL